MNDDNTIDIGEIIRPHIVGFYRQGVRDGAQAQKVVDDMVARFKATDSDGERLAISRILATYSSILRRGDEIGELLDDLAQIARWLSGSQAFPGLREARGVLRLCPDGWAHWREDCDHEEEK